MHFGSFLLYYPGITYTVTFSCRFYCSSSEFMVLSMMESHFAFLRQQSHDTPPLYFPDGIRYLCWNAVFVFHQAILFIEPKKLYFNLIY